MATLGAAYVTTADIEKQTLPDGTIANPAELLDQTNEMSADIPWFPSNKDSSNITVVRTGIPQPSLRRLYEGVTPTKTANAQIEDGMALLADSSVLDVDVPHGGNLGKLRMNERKGHLQGFMQYFQYLLLYGANQLDERQFNGLAIRYNALTGNVSSQVIGAGGTGTDNTSVWLINWGEDTVCGIYPKGTTAGLEVNDKGIQKQPTSVTSGAVGSGFWAYEDELKWRCGLAVKNYMHIVRIANIDVSDLTGATGTQASSATTYLIDLMADAIERIQNPGPNLRFYCTRRVRTWIRRQSAVKASNQINFDKPAGTTQIPILSVHGIPVRICDQILHSEDDAPATIAEFP